MKKSEIIRKTRDYVKKLVTGEGTGHDWWHVERVIRNARKIARGEGGDLFVIEIACLLHDIADWKFYSRQPARLKGALIYLERLGVDSRTLQEIEFIVKNISYRGGTNKVNMRSLEGKIVQDADRLDTLGAIGVARCFAYGGYREREIYNPDIKPKKYRTANQVKNTKSTSVNHFYEKVLLLKDRMNTPTAKRLAARGHRFIEKFLREFLREWNGKT